MKTKTLLSIMALGIMLSVIGQDINLTFTAIDNTTNVQINSIKVMNRTEGNDTVLYWPDTVLQLYQVGIINRFDSNANFMIHQNFPNPVYYQTTIQFSIPENGEAKVAIADIVVRM